MIAIPKKANPQLTPEHQQQFVAMLPTITGMARRAFSDRDPEAREELAAEVVAAAFVMFVRLIEQGRESLAYGAALALYGIKRVKIGRKAATPMNVRDVSSEYSQLAKGFSLQRLDRFKREEQCWHEVLVEDKTAGPAEIAASRIDVGDWYRSLPSRDRKIARFLSAGNTTTETARRFRVSAGRISQKRREYLHSWRAFQGECTSERGPDESRAPAAA